MSTEHAVARWSYGRTMITSLVVLIIIAVALAAAGTRQAPRVRAAQIDLAYATENGGAQLVLSPNQPVRSNHRVSVTTDPDTGATIRQADGRFVVTFAESLHYDTMYDVTVGPITGKYTGADGSLHYRFRTPSPALMTLVRSGTLDDGTPDRIVKLEAGDAIQRTVYRNDSILEWADAGKSIVVSTFDRGVNRLVRVGPDGRVQQTYALTPPAHAPIFGLRADARTGLFGYITPLIGDSGEHLYVHDVGNPSVGHTPIRATDGTPMEVINWLLVPGTREIVVQDSSGRVFMANPDKPESTPVPLGTYGSLIGFLPATTTLTLPDNFTSGIKLLDPLHGVSRTLPRKSTSSDGTYPLQQLLLDQSGRAIVLQLVSGGSGYRIAVIKGTKDRTLMATEPGKADDVSICLAPDGGHVAVIVQPSHGRDDGYPVQPSRAGVSTYFANTTDGKVREVSGSEPQWCSSGPTSIAVSPDGP